MSSRFAGGLPSTGGRGNRKVATIPAPPLLMLEKLPSQNLELSQVIHRDAAIIEQGYTKVMLRGVPRFLVDAFDRILKEGKTMEGLFRKEGNAARMKNSQDVYYCKESVTAVGNQWTIHDVCSLVKRFLRDLKTPLITPEIKARIFEYATKYPDGVIEPHKLTILFEPAFSDKGIIHPMPAEHIGTLGFIMRQLNELSKDHAVHQMTVENLATVFAPTIFREQTNTTDPPKTPKVTHGNKTSLVLQKSVEENELRISAMVVLIKNSQWIGVPSNFYLASRKESSSSATSTSSSTAAGAPSTPNWSRANSLRPSHSMLYGAAGLASLPISYSKAEKGGSVSGRKLEKRYSVKTTIATRGRQEEKQDKDHRRSNSKFRDGLGQLSKFVDRVRRKSGERNSPGRHLSPQSAGKIRGKDGGGSMRGRSPVKKMLLEVDDHAVSALAAPLDHYEELKNAVATSRPSLKSSSFLQSLPAKSPKLQSRCVQQPPALDTTFLQPSKPRPARPPPPAPRVSTTKIERVASGEKKKGRTIERIPSGEKKKAKPIERVASGEKKKGSPAEGRRRVSAAAAEIITTQPLPRRSITSVRDEPNSILGDDFFNQTHKFPVNRLRRHTAPIKTGLALRRNQPNTVHSGLKGPMMRRAMTMAAADDKENTRALIRVRRRGDEEDMDVDEWGDEEDETLTDTNRTMTGGIAVVYPSETILEMNHMESRARRNNRNKMRISGGEGGSGRGSATSSKLILTPVKDEAAAAAPSKSSKSPAPPPLPQCSPPSSAERVSSGRRSSKRSVGREEKDERRREEDDVEMPLPPLSAPPIPCPRSSLGGGTSPHFAIPSLPSARASSVSSAFTTPSTSRRPIATTPLAAKTPVAANSPLGRRGSSASALDSPQFKAPSAFSTRRQMSVGEKDFAFSDRNRAAILGASDATELHSNTKEGTRPSVALLRSNNKGMVAARVNLFAAIQSTNEAENASMRLSSGSRHSLTGLDETLSSTNVRGGPPVGHSIMSSGGSSSSNSSKRSSIASHR